MITSTEQSDPNGHPHTIWGLNPVQLHDRFWAARGVQVIRQGEPSELASSAELFLLSDPHSLTIFRLAQLVETLSWLKPRVLFVRLHNTRGLGYRERVITDGNDRFIRFERVYNTQDWRLGRVALTPSREVASFWQNSTDPRNSWQQLRRSIDLYQRSTLSINGRVYDSAYEEELSAFIRELVQVWQRPDVTIRRVRRLRDHVWCDPDFHMTSETRFVGPVWIGAGRSLNEIDSVVGPAVLWDEPERRPEVPVLEWQEIEPTEVLSRPVRPKSLSSFQRIGKRAFDIVFALVALLLSLPLYPAVMLAIWLEDGWPFFFAHNRESMGGREFPCLKFRTMRKDAEKIKASFQRENVSDGPHFFIEKDPRHTRVGRFLRKTNLDELPQFFNVLLGHMSIVGPRPSPYSENQYCPPWREARLSVRPGITGWWQVNRSREQGLDFQEWIRYDIEYVERMSWRLDLYIIYRTLRICLKM